MSMSFFLAFLHCLILSFYIHHADQMSARCDCIEKKEISTQQWMKRLYLNQTKIVVASVFNIWPVFLFIRVEIFYCFSEQRKKKTISPRMSMLTAQNVSQLKWYRIVFTNPLQEFMLPISKHIFHNMDLMDWRTFLVSSSLKFQLIEKWTKWIRTLA